MTTPIDISPEAVETFCDEIEEVTETMLGANRLGTARALADSQALIRALRTALTARESLLRDIQTWFNDKRMGTYQYMEGSDFYEDKSLMDDRITDLLGEVK